ncbi:MAG: cell division protein FtsL [Pseudomonadota bacterium]|jgi:cell division protein FtsL|nr:cell division protein FtsL [Pseudomonadota bacterium]
MVKTKKHTSANSTSKLDKTLVNQRLQAEFLQEKSTLQNIAIIFVLLVAVMGSAFMVVHQVFQYRYDYRGFTKLIREKDNLNAEWGRLLIEQQTFGATAQIGSRAVTQLRMFSPPASQTVVIASNQLATEKIALGESQIEQTEAQSVSQ